MKKWAALIAAGTLALSGCSWFSASSDTTGAAAGGAVTKESVTAAIAAAEAAFQASDKAGFAWRDSEKNIKAAKAALEKGELEQAMKLAKEVEAQEKVAVQQAEGAKTAKPWLF